MVRYISEMTREIMRRDRVQRQYEALGWHDENSLFVLGDKAVTKDGIVPCKVHSRSPISRLAAIGNAAAWSQGTDVFNDPRWDNMAFALLCGFGSPLLALADRSSAVVSLAGQSGYGKTLSVLMAISIYGDPKVLYQAASATHNAVERQLVSNQNIPYLLDEVSGMHPKRLAEFLYVAANGRGKDSLTQAREMRFSGSWHLIPFVTTNRPIGEYKDSDIQEAHRQRLFELYYTNKVDKDVSEKLFEALQNNYGSAAPVYLQYIMKFQKEIPAMFEAMEKKLMQEFNLGSENRFTVWTLTAAALGALFAKRCGLIRFDTNRVIATIGNALAGQMKEIQTDDQRFTGVVTDFINENLRDINFWTGKPSDLGTLSEHRNPIGRYNKEDDCLYLLSSRFKALLIEEGVSDHNLRELYARAGVRRGRCRLVPHAASPRCVILPCSALGLDMKDLTPAQGGE